MEHEVAVKSHAVERYFLGEMMPEEQDAFEEHFFVCDLCAREVRAASDFIQSTKSIFVDPGVKAKRDRNWLSWIRPVFSYRPAYAAVATACLAVMAYQNTRVIPALKAPQAITSSIILEGNTRSALPKLHEGDPARIEMPWDRGGAAFVELRRDSHVISKGAVKAPPRNQPLDVYFPGDLEPGRYSVVVRALDSGRLGPEVMEGDFDVVPPQSVMGR